MSQGYIQSLKILLLSDIHEQFLYLQKVIEWYQQQRHNLSFDYIFISGDSGNLDYTGEEEVRLEDQIESQKNMIKILKDLEVFECPILYVPGNHDCQVQYKNKALTNRSYNIHKNVFKLIQGLRIIGFGGSLPALFEGQIDWIGHPFKSQKQFKTQFHNFPKQTNGDQFILLTHVGPTKSTTTVDTFEKWVESGSQTLQKFIEDESQFLCLHIHGHTHEARGMSQYRSIPIINPGAVSRGNFAILDLKKQQKWRVQNLQFLDLNFI